jgi:hypothetical protein
MADEIPVRTIPKNSTEELRVSLTEFNGHRLLNLRVFYDAEGTKRPGKQGLALRIEQLPQLIEALHDAHAEAVANGFLRAEQRPAA